MKIKEIRKLSRQNFSKNGLFSIIIMIFAGLICGSIMLLNLFFADLFIFIVPLIILPTMFAFQRAIIALREENVLSFSLVFSGYRLYFSERFSSTYSFFKNLLKLLIIYVGTSFISTIVINLSFYFSNFMGFKDIISEIMNSDLSVDVINSLLEKHALFFEVYQMANTLPALFAVSIMGLFCFSISGHSFFLRVSGLKYAGAAIKEIFHRFLKRNRKEFFNVYLALNWPLYLLFIFGLALGGYVGSVFRYTYGSIFAFATAFAIFLSFGIYGSIYFANKEALYYAFLDKIQIEEKIINSEIKKAIEQLRNSSEISSLIGDLDNVPLEEDEKNDPDES